VPQSREDLRKGNGKAHICRESTTAPLITDTKSRRKEKSDPDNCQPSNKKGHQPNGRPADVELQFAEGGVVREGGQPEADETNSTPNGAAPAP